MLYDDNKMYDGTKLCKIELWVLSQWVIFLKNPRVYF